MPVFHQVFLDKDSWFIDSGASFHMTPRDDWISNKYQHEIKDIAVANDSKLKVQSAGEVVVNLNRASDSECVSINGVLHVPKLLANLLSVSQMVEKGFTVVFNKEGCQIYDLDKNLFATGSHVNHMFKLDVLADDSRQCLVANSNKKLVYDNLWHRRMGHINYYHLAKLQERARSIIFDAGLTKGFWAEAISTAAYIINRSPTSGLHEMTPEEAWSNKKPDLSHLRVFGCQAMLYVPKPNRRKLDPRSRELIFVGYRFLHSKTRKLVKSRYAVFLENQFIGNSTVTESNSNKFVTGKRVDLNFVEDRVQVEDHAQLEDQDNFSDNSNEVDLSNDSNDDTFVSVVSDIDEPEETIVLPRRSERSSKQRIFPFA